MKSDTGESGGEGDDVLAETVLVALDQKRAGER
jgi:hypothetical protein